MIQEIYGAKAEVYLRYEGEIEPLCAELVKSLKIPDFQIETESNPPHEIIGISECLGFFITVKKTNYKGIVCFLLTIETELSLDEAFNNKMYDLSAWLARFISTICEIEVL